VSDFQESLSAEHDSLRQGLRAASQNFAAAIRHLVGLVDTSATDSDFDLAQLRIIAARGVYEVALAALKLSPAKILDVGLESTHSLMTDGSTSVSVNRRK
jgi:hypothetical protein